MIVSPFGFFQMQIKRRTRQSSVFGQTNFGDTPKSFHPIDVNGALGKFILPMINAKMFLIPHINQARVATPTVRVNDTLQVHTSANNRLQRGFQAIRHNFGIDFAIPLKDAKHNRFAICPSAPFAFHAPSPEETFVNFYGPGKGRSLLTLFCNPASNFRQIRIDGIPIQARQYKQSGSPSDQQQTPAAEPEIWLQKYAHDEQGGFSLSCQYLALDESAKLVMTHF